MIYFLVASFLAALTALFYAEWSRKVLADRIDTLRDDFETLLNLTIPSQAGDATRPAMPAARPTEDEEPAMGLVLNASRRQRVREASRAGILKAYRTSGPLSDDLR